ncbi:HNH endonuclease [Bradyrhizobium sp. 2]|nr:HNH endonuclease [Bradyrhizobium sp. 2]
MRAYVHQFVWLYVHGVWPDHDIDHRNRDTQNNTISNLRRATASENLANKKRPSNNTSGFKGVHPKRSKWCSQIRCGGQRITLGVLKLLNWPMQLTVMRPNVSLVNLRGPHDVALCCIRFRSLGVNCFQFCRWDHSVQSVAAVR